MPIYPNLAAICQSAKLTDFYRLVMIGVSFAFLICDY